MDVSEAFFCGADAHCGLGNDSQSFSADIYQLKVIMRPEGKHANTEQNYLCNGCVILSRAQDPVIIF